MFRWFQKSPPVSVPPAAQIPAPVRKAANSPHAFALAAAFPEDVGEPHEVAVVWRRFRACATLDADCRLGTMAWCSGTPDRIRLGERTICRGILQCDKSGGAISIGDWVYIGNDVIISSRASVSIGDRTLIAHGVQIFDNDSHPMDPVERHLDYVNLLEARPRIHKIAVAPIVIGEDCWLGMNSLIMKGVTIGARSVVAAGSVVTRDVAEDCLVAGNPAKVVRTLR